MSTVAEKLLTAEEFCALPDNGRPSELVRGRVVEMNVPFPRHGQICGRIIRIVGRFLDGHDLGHLVSNDSGVLTERDPDTVRGPDVSFFSYSRVPRGPFPQRYLDQVPELVFEVRSPNDRWPPVLAKVAEYLDAGVGVVCVLDPASETAFVYRAEQQPQAFAADQELTLPDVLGDFRAPARGFFE
jgi:Uma2 family endonuclease